MNTTMMMMQCKKFIYCVYMLLALFFVVALYAFIVDLQTYDGKQG